MIDTKQLGWLKRILKEKPAYKVTEFSKIILRQSKFKLDQKHRGLSGSFLCSCGAMGTLIHGLFECEKNKFHSFELKRRLGARWSTIKIPMDLILIAENYDDLVNIMETILMFLKRVKIINLDKF